MPDGICWDPAAYCAAEKPAFHPATAAFGRVISSSLVSGKGLLSSLLSDWLELPKHRID